MKRKNERIAVRLGDDRITQSSLKQYVELDRRIKELTGNKNKLKAKIIAALKEGREADTNGGGWRARLVTNPGKPKWKTEALTLAAQADKDLIDYEQEVKDKYAGKTSESLKVD